MVVYASLEVCFIKELEGEINCLRLITHDQKIIWCLLVCLKNKNIHYVSHFIWLCSAQIKLTVQGLFDLNQNIPAFKEHLRDFMVQIKVGNLNLYQANLKNINFVV